MRKQNNKYSAVQDVAYLFVGLGVLGTIAIVSAFVDATKKFREIPPSKDVKTIKISRWETVPGVKSIKHVYSRSE